MKSKSGQMSLNGQIVLLVKSNQSGSLPLMMIFVFRVSVNTDSEIQADQVGDKFKEEAH